MTTEKFKEMKAKYVAKHGYTMTVPGLSDIIKIGMFDPITHEEEKAWKRKDRAFFSEKRWDDINKEKKKKKEKFLAMLGSPTPHIVNNAGSIMTSIDNAQDCLGTLGFIGQLAIKTAPRLLGAALSWPVALALGAAEMLNTLGHLGHKKVPRLGGQHAVHSQYMADSKGTKFKMVKAAKTMKWCPRQGRVIEAAQVTADVFGIGICLGPLVGFAIEAVTGPMRRISGKKVNVKVPWLDVEPWTGYAQRTLFSDPVYIGAGLQTEDEEVTMVMMAHYLAAQEISVAHENWNPLDNVENIDEIEKLAPKPTNILTQEVIAEEGINVDDIVGWPHSSKPWALLTDVVNELDQPCQQFQDDFVKLHKNDWWPYAFGALSRDSFGYTMETAEGRGSVTCDLSAYAVVGVTLTQFDMCPDPNTAEPKMKAFADQINMWEAQGIRPTLDLITRFCDLEEILLGPFS